ncbi:hypothetical protein [Micromonospora sp. NBC_01813]|uniref:hypothetical protein n=1 Tax=Micromonospora sp. NBC_01813 TaxID=2975988 RepID=UPI002DDBEEBF|nr:hypothetical protein [Micromonospora sp. NBC_01813]WSA11475.1 hypothetical protein OG958_12235 [Micromonospora sp. NBC_01813]
MADTVIDLGEVGRTASGTPPADAYRPRPGRRLARPWSAVLLVVAVLATVTAAAPLPPHPEPVHLDAGDSARTLIDGDLLFVIDQPEYGRRVGGGGQATTVAVYRLPGGDPRWRFPVPVEIESRRGLPPAGITVVGDMLLIGFYDLEGARTTAFGIGDGAVRWQADGAVLGVTTDGAVALWNPLIEADPELSGSLLVGATVHVVEAGSGRARWSMTSAGHSELAHRFEDDRLVQLVEIEPGNRVRIRDAATGLVRTAGTLAPEHQIESGHAWVVAGLLVTMTDGILSAFELAGLTPRWSVPAPPVGEMTVCASLICVNHSDGGGRALDPVDGSTRWADDGWHVSQTFGRFQLVVPRHRDGTLKNMRLVADPATGELVAPGTERWSAFAVDGDGWLAQWYDPGAAEAWVARIAADGSTPRVLLHLPEGVAACQAGPTAVVCRRADGGLGIWELPD